MNNPDRRKWWILGSLTLGLLAVGLDLTVLNVAIPTLATDLQASTTELQWIVDSYNLVLAAALLPAGMLGDRYGRKKWLLIALLLFGAASVACAYSGSIGTLIAMRAVLGLGAAFLIPLSMSILPVLFAEEERGKAMTLWAMANMLGIPLGPIVGGWLLQHYAWGSIFLINVPLVLAAIAAVAWLMPESRSGRKTAVDVTGTVLSSAGLVGLTYGVIRAGEQGWDDAVSLAVMLGGFLVLALFVLQQKRSRHPLVDLSLFGSGSFTWGAVLATLVSFALFGLLFVLPQFFQAVSGADTLTTGLRLLPLIGGLIAGAKIAERLTISLGAKIAAAAGFAVIAAGLIAGSATGAGSGFGFIAAWTAVVGIGLGLVLPTVMSAALGVLSAERSGVGSALIMAFRQVGGAIGVALLGAALNHAYRSRLDLGGLPDAAADAAAQSVSAGMAVARQLQSAELADTVRHSFVHGMETMLLLCGGIALLGVALTIAFLPRRVPAAEPGSAPSVVG